MAEWDRNKVSPSEINNGKQFTRDDDLTVEELNAMVNNSFYGVDFAENMADQPDISEINSSGSPEVSIIDNVKNGITYKKFKFKNLIGKQGKSAYEYAVDGGYQGSEEDFANELAGLENVVHLAGEETITGKKILEQGLSSDNTVANIKASGGNHYDFATDNDNGVIRFGFNQNGDKPVTKYYFGNSTGLDGQVKGAITAGTIQAKTHLESEGTFKAYGDAEFLGNVTKNNKPLLTEDDLPNDYVSFKEAQSLTEEEKAQARENIGVAGGSSFSGSYKELTNKPYDVVITSQNEFENLIASDDWLGAKSVAFIGDGGNLQFTASDTITIPQTVMQIQGFNNATIKITPASYSYGLWYSTKPNGSGYSISDIKVIIPSTSYAVDAVARMVNLTNVDVEVEEGNTTVIKTGFSSCDNLINCKSNVPTLGFSFCNYLVNCIGTNTRETGYGYLNCSYGVNCVGTSSGGEQWLSKELHPIGSIYMSVDTTSPASLYGGTWERIAQGRAIFGAGTLNGIEYTADGTIDAGLPNIAGRYGSYTYTDGSTRGAFEYVNQTSNNIGSSASNKNFGQFYFNASNGECGTQEITSSNSGDITYKNNVYGKSNTVQPNAYVVYVWKRVA